MKRAFFSYLLVSLMVILSLSAEETLLWQEVLNERSIDEREALEVFFKTMLINSEGGYVVLGSKPVCVEGIRSSPFLLVQRWGGRDHQRSVELAEGWQLWRQHFDVFSNGHILIHCKDRAFSTHPNWIHLLWINPGSLEKVFEANKAFFQFIVDPNIDFQSLLKYLTDPQKPIFKSNVLMGIIMGFGSQNAIPYERIEELRTMALMREEAPYLPRKKQLSIYPPEMDLNYSNFDRSIKSIPSLYYKTLQEEYKALLSHEKKTPQMHRAILPAFPVFGIFKEDQETRQILESYTKDQRIIQSWIEEDKFLENLLSRLLKNAIPQSSAQKSIKEPQQSFTDAQLIAYQLLKGLPSANEASRKSLCKGLIEACKGEEKPKETIGKAFTGYLRSVRKAEAKRNLMQTESWLNQLASNNAINWIVPFKLGYHVKAEGKGKILDKRYKKAKLDYAIRIFNKEPVIGQAEEEEIDFSLLLPSFIQGMQGMKTGEERMIYLHPEMAYGENGFLDPNVGLQAYVKLIEIIEEETSEQKEITLETLSFKQEADKPLPDTEEALLNYLYVLGYNLYDYLKNAHSLFAIADLCEAINSVDLQLIDFNMPSSESFKRLNHLHWKIYQQKRQEAYQQADHVFADLSKDPAYVCLHPGRVYCKGAVREKPAEENSIKMIKYAIRDKNGKLIKPSSEEIVCESGLIRGIYQSLPYLYPEQAYILYIHPEWGYKNSDSLVGNKELIVHLKLLSE
ncbi:FKBP-type peptidyl-prolyl cis-trans isomerase [Candidatus Protochlamydia phocaeensis]|uniref:FKBP-type peptidyl-prolyl cis-trans isomerase n=1 Tax=Candidatus Protochlamydia phocaeensis TaxID=1414722 RepID=UPI0008387D76|nr:FKBP-type peptidyl-prolyl cis-trans isomerase [Candidatus Protochlamydia phocaeensis]